MKTLLTVLISVVLFSLFLTVVFFEIKKRKEGKHSCSCGGSCGSCPMGCHDKKTEK